MSIQRVLGAALTNATAPFTNIIEEFKALRAEAEQADWPVEMVFGKSDGVTETGGFTFDHKTAILARIDETIEMLEAAEQFYMELLKALPD